jgi:two-component system, chemotaxis family, sensor kinase Cph1
MTDVILQFRSVRMLIAQDQLESVSKQVRLSNQPVIVVDASGRILLTNESFERLLPAVHPHLHRLEDLPQFFLQPVDFRTSLRDMLKRRHAWRGEISLVTDAGGTRPLMVRADPVFSSPDRVLGFVLMFTDLTQRKAAESARRQFQESIIGRPRICAVQLELNDSLVYQSLLSSIVENAQLAALEITYGVDTARMQGMLESVRASVTRSSELLEHLIWHSRGAADESDTER